MLDPNDIVIYITGQQQVPEATEEMPEWLKNFLADDDEYDIFSK
jgi:hypothetical protein